ncbi:MAG: zf-HC2 domain-containing protein [Vicinamibacterales bacterium]
MTMTPPHLSEEDLVLAYYRELPGDEQRAADAHLAVCAACRDGRARLVETLGLVDAAPPAEPPPGFERVMWARVQAGLAEQAPLRWWALPRWAVAGAAAAVLVVAAFLAGRWSGAPASPDPAPATIAAVSTPPSDAPERILLVAAGDHFDRTQMVLAELVNADPAQAGILDAERARAADLVSTNRVIRQSAVAAGDEVMAGLLEDLERVLLEVANGGGDDAAAELEMVKTRIESRGILFRLRVITSDVRQRETQPRRMPAPVS